MNREQYAALQEWFDGYVEASYRENQGFSAWIKLKDEHTRRVVDNITRIGRSLALTPEDLLLAQSVALLHDAGRFAQVKMYGTFNDRRSENHATLGTRVLARAAVLKDLSRMDADLVTAAIELHNLRDLPEGLPGRLSLLARLIQDADKLDILGLFTRFYTGGDAEFGTVLDTHLPDTPGYSGALVEDILAGKLGDYKDVHNRNDRKLLHLSWVYGVHFGQTLAEIAGSGYVDKTVGALPDTGAVREIHRRIRSYMSERAAFGPGDTCGRPSKLPQITC